MDLYSGYRFTKITHHDVYPKIHWKNPELSVKGQNVLISGGGSGIGLATAKFYAKAGAKTVVITGRRSAPLEEAKDDIRKDSPGTDVVTIPTDVSSKASVDALWTTVRAKVGNIHVLVNNAGRSGNSTRLGDGNEIEWWATQETNLLGTYLMTEKYISSLKMGGATVKGTVIIIASQMGFVEHPGSSAYSISKLAVAKLAQHIDVEYPTIRAFATHPGIIPTELAKSLGDAAKDTVELGAGLNLYLASPRADFLRGRYVTANWDIEELEAHQSEILAQNMLRVGILADIGPEGHEW
ncbi:hypothetical protein BGW36DRAFT_433129 [Talaromyces proteolyticus]|uniref:NAD(P)-binding protein n=1 Tax=Talaromyces proteolyticus TaxID=1131652 RepID=A0AAD4PUJ7_9EURO|nr:uncharacterized protein BGW36DRAFT_433129 [Talaromyces proteolyticus]KAH8690177.1 hypothetical protein BGW36DRAFT_433129 [Talaromyces proteolyticus]